MFFERPSTLGSWMGGLNPPCKGCMCTNAAACVGSGLFSVWCLPGAMCQNWLGKNFLVGSRVEDEGISERQSRF